MTKIQWTDRTWNPVRGCSLVSPGCTNCYAMRQAHRSDHPGGAYQGLTKISAGGPVWTGDVRVIPELLNAPFHWKAPCRVFVNSMSDLFHESVPEEFILRVFETMAATPRHSYQILTKRPERMLYSVIAMEFHIPIWAYWPLPNVWLGVSVEDDRRAIERMPILQRTPATVRFVSIEPLLSEVKAHAPRFEGIHWAIIGGESGAGARTCDVDHIRQLVRALPGMGVKVFVKQLGSRPIEDNRRIRHEDWKGGDPSEWPADLRVREWPA